MYSQVGIGVVVTVVVQRLAVVLVGDVVVDNELLLELQVPYQQFVQ